MDQIETAAENAEPNEPNSKRDRMALAWFGIGALAGAVAAIGAMTILNAANAPVNSAVSAPPSDALANAPISARPFDPVVVGRESSTQGKLDAPVKIIEYGDFECGFCKRFHEQTLQKVIDEYVATGRASFSYKHYPFLAQSSTWKAEAAECAAEQGRFWDFHDELFEGKVTGGDEKAVKDQLIALAGDLKLDAASFKGCLDEKRTQERVQADLSEGQELGVRGTPSFLIDGKPLVGAQPFEAFKKAIEAAIADKPAP
jgi:protein-disulfide isomerase